MPKELVQWDTFEFEHREKNAAWYATFWFVAAALVIYEAVLRDYFAAATFVIIAAVVGYIVGQRPRPMHVAITDQGIRLGSLMVPYANVTLFWIVDHDRASALHIETTGYLNHYRVISFNGQNPDVVRDVLRRYVREGSLNHETVTAKLGRFLGF